MGPALFSRNGLYGVTLDGKVTCPARFKRVKLLQENCGFFALGVYMRRNMHDFGKVEEVTTVIDSRGRDLQVVLYGDVSWRDGYFCGVRDVSGCPYVNCWDPVGECYYYDTYPEFRMVAGLEVGWGEEHAGASYHCLRLRRSTGRVSPRFEECEMFFNGSIVIARDYLIVKRDRNHSYRISGYLGDSVLVESDAQPGYQQIFSNGRKGELFMKLPEGYTRVMDMRKLRLRRVEHR